MNNKVRKKQSISIVVPVLNEQETIPELIYRIEKSLEPTYNYEIIFVDDRSTDNTAKVIQNFVDDKKVLYFIKLGPAGKAQALLEGFSYAKYDLIAMIDSDLQYPPEAIPDMIQKINKGSDIVIAERKEAHSSFIRKAVSRTFNFIFARFLHNIKFDVQSGLKVFKKEIIERISIRPFPWTFDLEFLLAAKSAGYQIAGEDIVFDQRKNGQSKVNLIVTSIQIGFSALLLKLKSTAIVPFHKNRKDALGPGFHYKGVEFIHFSDLQIAESAVKTIIGNQLIFILAFIIVFMLGILINWKITIISFVALITIIYFIDLLFNFFLIYRSFTKSPEIKLKDEEVNKITEWPTYTIFCPLYREWVVIPQFVKAIEALDYPKDKLQVQLLLEEDDTETIEHVKHYNLPSYFEVIVVPHSLPKTKPKACNYGLRFAKGEYAVIYDAEDKPDPLQLKKAVVAFQKSNPNIACIQAKLNYYNSSQNLLTRLFTAEYSLWFDLVLTGLQSIQAPIPLGGTSNHFKVDKLREVKGWDSFNVTEDCDLGIRLVKKGYYTAIIDSVTMEEANSNFFNWINQRSRWIKGYMQTYLVHMRRPKELYKKGTRAHFFTFQLVVGGKILSLFINPFMWVTTILYFSLRSFIGPTIEEFFPGPIFYMGVFSLIFGNFLYIYYYMIGCAKREQYDLIKFIFVVPLYWIAMSYAAWVGFIQLIFNPHYWPKTVHGLHLDKKEEVTESVLKVGFWQSLGSSPLLKNRFKFALSKKQIAGALFILSNALTSFLNFAYSAYLGRTLTLEDFALVSLINGLISLTAVVFGSLGLTITYKLGYLSGKFGERTSINFWAITRRNALKISVAMSLIWVALTPFLLHYFQLDYITPLLLFSPILLVNLAAATDKGLLFSEFNFKALSLITIGEPLLRLIIAIVLVSLGFRELAYVSIPFAAVGGFIIGWSFVFKNHQTKATDEENKSYTFPVKFFFSSFILGISTIIFMNLDVILAKHYLNSADAGLYALTALIGKMIFFLGSLAAPFTVPLVSKNEGANRDSRKFLNLTILATLLLTIPSFIGVAFLGKFLLPILFGDKVIATLPYLAPIAFGMVCYSVAKVLTDYYLAKKYFSFTVVSITIGIIQLISLELFHGSIQAFVYVMSAVWTGYSLISFILHLYADQVKTIENNIVDFLNLFESFEPPQVSSPDKLRILIFNWRDIKHKWSGGAEVYVHELAKRWVKDGNSVTIFCGNTGAPRNEEIDGIQIFRRGGFYMVYFWAFLYYMFKFRGKYDVILDSENGIPFFTPLYAKEKTILLIHHVHQEVFRKSLHWPLSIIALTLEAKIMPYIYRNTEVVTVSPSSKEEIMKHKLSTKEPQIVYNGVDLSFFKPALKSKTPTILYLGRLQYYKSLNVFIKAAKIVLEEMPNVKFIIAGEGEEGHKLKKFAKEKGLEDKIEFVGKVTDEEKIKLYQRAWIFVNPSFMEGWGITTIEANACGTPTVASDVPGLKDSINNNKTGLLVPYGDVNGFAKSILKLLKNRPLRSSMSKNAITWAKDFTWDTSADKFITIVKNSPMVLNWNRKLSVDEN